MKVYLVCGSRYAKPTLAAMIEATHGADVIICAESGETAFQAQAGAIHRGIFGTHLRIHSAYDHGDLATGGMARNSCMVHDAAWFLIGGVADVQAVAFVCNRSREAWDCVLRARRVNITPKVIRLEPPRARPWTRKALPSPR